MPPVRENEYQLIRMYNAPVGKVWAAWVKPEQVMQWWGPRGFRLTNHKKDVRTGGEWRYTMHGPGEGGVHQDFENVTKFIEVIPEALLVYDHGATPDTPPMFRVRVEFKAIEQQTQLTFTMSFKDAETLRERKAFIKKASGDSTWDRLGEYLEKTHHGRDVFVINRTFPAPIERLFQLFTEPEHLVQWTGPTGSQYEFLEADIRVGGHTFSKGTDDNGRSLFAVAKYLELSKPHRIVYTQQFADEKKQLSTHPLAPTWPKTMLTTVTLTSEDTNQTRVTIEWQPIENPNAEELNTFIAARAGMTQGWGGSFDKLEAYGRFSE